MCHCNKDKNYLLCISDARTSFALQLCMILTVLPERDADDVDTQKLRKHMRWALNELDLSETEHRSVQCIKGCLSQNLDTLLQFHSASGYETVIVPGARMFLALALTLRPCMRPTRYVVFLGPRDAADVPYTTNTSACVSSTPAAAPGRNTRGRWRQLWQSLRCSCTSVRSEDVCNTATTPSLPKSPTCSVLLIDTSNGDNRTMPWRMYLRNAIASGGIVIEWMSALSGYAAAARDGARIVDFLGRT